jgi:hypothetical protein
MVLIAVTVSFIIDINEESASCQGRLCIQSVVCSKREQKKAEAPSRGAEEGLRRLGPLEPTSLALELAAFNSPFPPLVWPTIDMPHRVFMISREAASRCRLAQGTTKVERSQRTTAEIEILLSARSSRLQKAEQVMKSTFSITSFCLKGDRAKNSRSKRARTSRRCRVQPGAAARGAGTCAVQYRNASFSHLVNRCTLVSRSPILVFGGAKNCYYTVMLVLGQR